MDDVISNAQLRHLAAYGIDLRVIAERFDIVESYVEQIMESDEPLPTEVQSEWYNAIGLLLHEDGPEVLHLIDSQVWAFRYDLRQP